MRREALVKKAAAVPALLGYAANAGARTAGRSGVFSKALNWTSSKLGRYKELMAGGNKELVGGYNTAKAQVRAMIDAGLRRQNRRMTDTGLRLYNDLISARFGGQHVSRVFRDSNGVVQKVTDTEKVLSPATISELNKVLGARAATATGVTGAGLLGYNAVSGGEKKAAEALTAYEQGFMDKCAELGVDPAVLAKAAAGIGNGR